MSTKFCCNNCAETEGGFAPCFFEVPDCLGKPPASICPVSGDECEWDECQTQENKVSPVKSPNSESTPCEHLNVFNNDMDCVECSDCGMVLTI